MVFWLGSEGRLVLLLLLVLALSGGPCSSNGDEGGAEPVYSRQWAVHLEGGERAADAIAAKHGFINLGKIFGDTYHFHHNDVARRSVDPSEEHHGRLTGEPNVRWAKQQVIKRRVKRDFMPFRPRSSPRPFVPNDPRWPFMWYLNRGGGLDMNVRPAWQEGITGRGVVVTILDDGLEKDHPDLSRNYDPEASFDVNNHDEDPMPRYDLIDSNRHGTRCAGEVAAAANNSICAIGVAFGAGVGGVRMLDGDVTDAVEARSLSLNPQHVDIYSASWGPDDDGKTVDGPGELATRAFVEGVTKGRGGKGSIFVWASGNGGRDHDNCNCDGYTNAIWTLSISSATENGLVPWYSEACSSTLATTYSSGSSGEKQVVTTDLHHLCTTGHTGTSASAPLAAGICALALEANKRLTWRDMQHIVVRTAKPANLRAPDWSVNGVGRNVSHSFGYGLMDASAMVRLARTWKTVPEQHRCEVLAPHVDKQIPAKSQVILQLIVKECAGVSYLEHVQAKISLLSSRRGDLQIHLTSPAGTRSTLLARRPHDLSRSGFQSWPFMSVHTWGEKPLGIWQLEIHNEGRYLGRATLREWALIFHGTPENPDNQRPPASLPLPLPHPPRRGGSSSSSTQSTRPRGHPSGSATKKNKYTPRGRNGTTESSPRNYPTMEPTSLKLTSPSPGPTVQEHIPPTPASSPAFVWGSIYFGDSVTSVPVGGTVSRITDPVRHPQEVMSGLRGGPGGVVIPRPSPPRRPPAGSQPQEGRPGVQALETAGKGTYGNHHIATLTDWELLLHGTGTAPGENSGGRPGEGNGIAARNSSGDAIKDKSVDRAPPTEAEVIPGGNASLGRARWKQDGGSNGGAKPSGPVITPATGPPPRAQGEWQDRKDQRNGVELTSMEEASGGCSATRGCIECSEGQFLHQGKCEPACPQQRFFVGLDAFSKPACLPCHYSCKACSGPNDYQCTECFEDSLPFPLRSVLDEHNQTEFRCIPSDVSFALYAEQWSFWMFVAFLSNAALILLIGAWLCFFGVKKQSSRAHIEGHIYEKVSGNDIRPHIRTGESKVIAYESSDDEDVN